MRRVEDLSEQQLALLKEELLDAAQQGYLPLPDQLVALTLIEEGDTE